MNPPPLSWTRTDVARLLRDRGIRLRRSFGQNYLVDPNFLSALVRDAEVGPSDQVVEIGSGLGNLTSALAARAARVLAFEIDPRILAISRELLADRPNVTFIEADGASFASQVRGPVKVVSNLPYGDWQKILLAVLEAPQDLAPSTFMIQSDVYDRIRSRPGSRHYGPMSALLQATASIRKLRRAGKELFLPVPRVESTVFRLERPRPVPDAAAIDARLRELFLGRRKKSRAAGGRRVEQLDPEELVGLARGLPPPEGARPGATSCGS